MSDRSPCVREPRLHRILASPMALFFILSLTASGCSPSQAPSKDEGGVTSKVPEIAKRQRRMDEMLKKGAPTQKTSAQPH
jgi:hypothetical protein